MSRLNYLLSCQNVCDALHYLLDYISIRFVSKSLRQIEDILMGISSAPLITD